MLCVLVFRTTARGWLVFDSAREKPLTRSVSRATTSSCRSLMCEAWIVSALAFVENDLIVLG